MNARRIADLLRRRAQLDLELAEAFEQEPANDAPSPRRKHAPPTALQPPARAPTELEMQSAKQSLRRLGYRVKP